MLWAALRAARQRRFNSRSRKGRPYSSAIRPKPRLLSVEALEERVLLANFIDLAITRADDPDFPATEFIATLDVNVPDETGVSGVSVTLGGGAVSVLGSLGGGMWFAEESFTSLAAAKTALNGLWSVLVSTPIPSTSTFNMNLSSLADGDFFPTPTITNPTQGASAVPSNTTFTWTDPTGASTPNSIQVTSQDNGGTRVQTDGNLSGSLNLTDTSWLPPTPLTSGPNEFDVAYLENPTGLVGDLLITAGSIAWSDAPFDPNVGGNPTPLLGVGSQSTVGFVAGATLGNDTVGLVDPTPSRFFLKNTNSEGPADLVFRFGPAGAGWTPIAGDWDGTSSVTPGLYDPVAGKFYLKNSNAAGGADSIFRFGPAGAGWEPISGDWDGDGTDTVGLFNPTEGRFFLKNTHAAGSADSFFRYGPAGAGWTPPCRGLGRGWY